LYTSVEDAHMSKVLSVRIKDELYTKVSTNKLSKAEVVSIALNNFLENVDSVYSEKNIENDEDVYNAVYSDLFNIEVLPLKKEVEYLTEINVMLQVDKDYFKQQINALMLAKMPLLARIKLKLLKGREG